MLDDTDTQSDCEDKLMMFGRWVSQAEFGNPSLSAEDYHNLLSYSPYDNIRDNARYPSMFVTAAFKDSRVPYWEPAKFVARLRQGQARTSPNIRKTGAMNLETRQAIKQ